MRKIGYLRVSTDDQNPDRQIEGLKDLCDELHVEVLSAASRNRPVYEAVKARLRKGDKLVVLDLDRAYRSALDALSELDALRRRGVDFVIANLRLDTTTPEGYYVYTIMSANSEFARRILSRRTREGLAAARLQGKRLGRPRKLTQRQVEHARERLNACECSKTALAKELKVGRWTLARALRRQAEAERPN